MKLYTHPVSPVGRPVLMFCADHSLPVEEVTVDLFAGDQFKPEFAAINPNCAVPVLEDGEFRLSESSAILKYLADKIVSPTYPSDLKLRAKINAAMDWFNTGFYNGFGHQFCYQQVIPQLQIADESARNIVIARGKAMAEKYLSVLNDHMIGANNYVCGPSITLADYLGAGITTVGDVTGCNFAQWSNVQRWIATMKSRPNWAAANVGLQGWIDMARGPNYIIV
jgi:glutathione S-transferase